MRALGATEGMAFDGGGSSTIVARRSATPTRRCRTRPPTASNGRSPTGFSSLAPRRPARRRGWSRGPAPFTRCRAPTSRCGSPRSMRPTTSCRRRRRSRVRSNRPRSAASVTANSSPSTWNGPHRAPRRFALRVVPVEVSRGPARILLSPPQPNVDGKGRCSLQLVRSTLAGTALDLRASAVEYVERQDRRARRISHADAKPPTSADHRRRAGRVRVTVGSHEVALPFADHAHFVTLRAAAKAASPATRVRQLSHLGIRVRRRTNEPRTQWRRFRCRPARSASRST